MIPESLKKHFILTDKCPICSSKKIRKLFIVKGLTFNRCKECCFRFMNPFLSDEGVKLLYQDSKLVTELNPALESYYEYGTGDGESRTYRDYEAVLSLLEKSLLTTERPRLFEVGYGSGAFLKAAQKRGWCVDGIDTSEDNFKMLTDSGMQVQLGLFDSFIAPHNRYHAVALWDVIEHTIRPKDFIRKAYQMLTPGGLLVIATPNISGLLNKVSEILHFVSGGFFSFGVNQLYLLEHVGYFNEATLKKMLTDVGFVFEKSILSETDLKRYHFSPALKFCLKIFFILARAIKMGNRIIVVARKPEK